jgi:hypothetical protein
MSAKRKLQTPKILHDLPLAQGDQADFNFDAFAITLARLAASKDTRTPLVMGVSGAWGTGKTTLLKRIEIMLKTRAQYFEDGEEADFRKCKTVWFDAWKYQDESELLVALVRRILQEIALDGLDGNFKAFLGEDETGGKYDLVGMFINAFQLKFGGLGAEVQVKLDPQKHYTTSPFETHTAFFDYFDKAFEKLLALWVHGFTANPKEIDESQGALVVFIDDLDRCLPAKTVQVLEAVKLFLDKKGCVFILGADADRVREAVNEHYKSFDAEASQEYLEKIIQLRFNLPVVPHSEMEKYVQHQSHDDDFTKHWQVISAGAELNPRKVKTFLNDINLAWALLRNIGKAHDGIKDDFVRWQALMRAAPFDFQKRVLDFDDIDLRFDFVQDALRWAGDGRDDQALQSYFSEYERVPRLRRTLRAIGDFGSTFDAATLDDFLHLSAPPPPVAREAAPPKADQALPESLEEISEKSISFEPVAQDDILRHEKSPVTRDSISRNADRLTLAGIEFCRIPAGKFLMGSKDTDKGC